MQWKYNCFHRSLSSLDCAHRAQSSAKASNLNQKCSGIRIQISGLIRIRISVGLLPKWCGFIILSASVISPSVMKIGRWLWEMLINLLKSPIPQWWEKWKSDPASVSGTGSPSKINTKFQWHGLISFAVIMHTDRAIDRQTDLIAQPSRWRR